MYVCAQSCLVLCEPMDCRLPGSSAHGIFQARILEWVAISLSKGSSRRRNQTRVSCLAGRFFTMSHLGNPHVQIYHRTHWGVCPPGSGFLLLEKLHNLSMKLINLIYLIYLTARLQAQKPGLLVSQEQPHVFGVGLWLLSSVLYV